MDLLENFGMFVLPTDNGAFFLSAELILETLEERVMMKQSQIKHTRALCVVLVCFVQSVLVRCSAFAAFNFSL